MIVIDTCFLLSYLRGGHNDYFWNKEREKVYKDSHNFRLCLENPLKENDSIFITKGVAN